MKISEHANYLLNEYGRLQFDYAAYCKPYGESLRNEARNNLEEYIAELEAAHAVWLAEASNEVNRLNARITELEAEIKKMKEYFHKPQHGSCCTCQKCGHIYDECRCDFDETYDENDILTARNAELEAFVNRLIEAGNTIVFETFEGYEKHGLFDFAPVNTWQVLVKDWKERKR